MKRTMLFLMIIMVCFSVFADKHSSMEASSLEDTSFVIAGYYKGAVTSSVSMVIKDYSGNRLYETDAVASDEKHVGDGNEGRIFTWTMTGNSSSNLTITFKFTPLQAEANGKFYRPAYTFKLYQNPTKNETSSEISDSMYSTNTKTVSNDTKGNSNSRYTNSSSISYSGKVTNRQYDYWSGGYNWTTWTKSGYCTLNITDYEDTAAGSYEYRSTVTVEFTVP